MTVAKLMQISTNLQVMKRNPNDKQESSKEKKRGKESNVKVGKLACPFSDVVCPIKRIYPFSSDTDGELKY